MKRISSFYIASLVLLFGYLLTFSSCAPPVNTYEKDVAIPNHAWSSSFKPEISFEIKDSATANYAIYVVVRHTDAYRYKNIWINVITQPPTGDARTQSLDLKLATDEKGWLGRGMDDIFEHRILIMPSQPLPKGTYHFKLENIMREDPLDNVMNVGIRLEKTNVQ
ncbi:MAG: gliding motility lipoprotein GldH [Chitinophagaceae bacterium]